MHPGLLLDKPHKPNDWWMDDKPEYVSRRLSSVCSSPGDPALLDSLRQRRDRALAEASRFEARTAAPMSLHLARANAFENAGLCLHPLYGFAYLPGSGLKGMARTFAELSGTDNALVAEVFGPPASRNNEGRAGAVVFHEAWPLAWPRLTVDIVNCHHRSYYDGEGAAAPPVDWEDPVPVQFLTVVPGARFSFAVSPRESTNPRHKELCARAASWLKSALVHFGAGAKTNAGYGRFHLVTGTAEPLPESKRFEATLTLVTPAFLAGALQQDRDCDLRPATLRGLLRWWWRALHAGRMPLSDLRRLEGFLWGTTRSSGAIALEVEPAGKQPPSQPFVLDEICSACRIPKPKGQKTSQGLLYLGYGMQGNKNGPPRRFLPQGASWRVRFVVRPRKDGTTGWSAEELLQHAKAALFALAHCGAIGSKARRGYGSMSLECQPPPPADLAGILALCPLKSSTGPADLHSPSLRKLIRQQPVECLLPGNEPWFAIDQLGAAYQSVAQKFSHDPRKDALGLPRKLDDPKGNKYLVHPNHLLVPGGDRKLNRPQNFRHASPLHFKLFLRDGRYAVRITAFDDPYLLPSKESKEFLGHAVDRLKAELLARADTVAPKASPLPRAASPTAPAPPPKPEPSLQVGQKCTGVLKERNKKGNWRVEETTTKIVGAIQNSREMPAEYDVGTRVNLIVKISTPVDQTAFIWTKEGGPQNA